ncbi:MAG: hypothetical protein IAF38_10355 [Bacteroidia bacterium]|nr:hypothetical protein [Bacteroidia bacterium]
MKPNFKRMLDLVDEVFETRSDPDQLQVNQDVLKRLEEIHPATLSELDEGEGPCVWILLIPTTAKVMEDFLSGKISEQEILTNTFPAQSFEAIYLCSATTLPEYRGKGISKKLCVDAIKNIQTDHPVKTLYYWPFTTEGKKLAESVAKERGLVLVKKE